jgi:hypothetical protein
VVVRPGGAYAGGCEHQKRNYQFDRFHGSHPFIAEGSVGLPAELASFST